MINGVPPLKKHCQHLCFKSNDIHGTVICDDCGVNVQDLNHSDPTTWTGSSPRAREVALAYQNAIKLLAPLRNPNRNIARIKEVRDSNGLNLKEAKKVVDYIIRPQLDVESEEVASLKRDQLRKKELLRSHNAELDLLRDQVRDMKWQLEDTRRELKDASHQVDVTMTWLGAVQRLTDTGFVTKAQRQVVFRMVKEATVALPVIDQHLTMEHNG